MAMTIVGEILPLPRIRRDKMEMNEKRRMECRGPGYWTGTNSSTPKEDRVRALHGTSMSGSRFNGRDDDSIYNRPARKTVKKKHPTEKSLHSRKKKELAAVRLMMKELKRMEGHLKQGLKGEL